MIYKTCKSAQLKVYQDLYKGNEKCFIQKIKAPDKGAFKFGIFWKYVYSPLMTLLIIQKLLQTQHQFSLHGEV